MPAFKIKNPDAPASDSQWSFLEKLAKDDLAAFNAVTVAKGHGTFTFDAAGLTGVALTKGEASAIIDAIKNAPKVAAAPATVNGTPFTEAPFLFSETQCKAISAAFGVVEMECGELTAADESVMAAINAALAMFKAPQAAPAPAAKPKPMSLTEMAQALEYGTPQQDTTPVHVSAQIPAGHYAVTGEDGSTDFYRVQIGKAGGKWEGFTFLDHQQGPSYVPMKAPKTKAAVLAKIAKDPAGASKRYGLELGVCGVCHTTLTNPESLKDGIGPVCKANMGWS